MQEGARTLARTATRIHVHRPAVLPVQARPLGPCRCWIHRLELAKVLPRGHFGTLREEVAVRQPGPQRLAHHALLEALARSLAPLLELLRRPLLLGLIGVGREAIYLVIEGLLHGRMHGRRVLRLEHV